MRKIMRLPAASLLAVLAVAVLLVTAIGQGRMTMNVVPQAGDSVPVYMPGATAQSLSLTGSQWEGIREYVDALCQRPRWQQHHEALCVRAMWKQNVTLTAAATASASYQQPTPVTQWNTGTMNGARFLIKTPDYAQLPLDYGRWSWMICGTAAAYLPSPYPIQDGPCEPGQVRTYGDYFSLAAGIRAGTSGPVVVFDPEWVPAAEAANPALYIRLGCQLATRHHVRVIVTPAGAYTATLWAELAVGARYCTVVEIQSQGAEIHPRIFAEKVAAFLRIVRAIPHHAAAMVGLATDPGGVKVASSTLLADYRWAYAQGVRRFWMNLCAWSPPKGDGTGDPQIAVAFFRGIGVSP